MAPLTKNVALLGHSRLAQSGTFYASSEQPGYPVSQLKNLSLWGSVYRSEEGVVTGVEIKIDLGASIPVQALVLVGTNLSDTAERAVVFSDNFDLSSPVLSVPSAPAFDLSLPVLQNDAPPWGRPLIYLRNSGPVTARYAAFQIDDPDNSRGYIRAAIGLAEDVWQPVRNMERSWERGGKLRGDPGVEQLLRELTIPVPCATQSEERQLMSLTRALKSTGRMMVIPEPLNPATWPQDAVWGTFSGTTKAVAVDKMGRFRTLAMNFQEEDE